MAEICIVGAGPAGIAAAIQLARAGHDLTVIERDLPGGTVRNARRIDNYPGYAVGISGPELAELLEDHLAGYVPETTQAEVERIERGTGGYTIHLASGASLGPFAGVVLATGSRPRPAGFPGEAELARSGRLVYEVAGLIEAHRSGSIATEGEVLIDGGGEAAIEYALSCDDRGLSVTLLARSGLRGIRSLVDAVEARGCLRVLHGEVRSATAGERLAVETSAGLLEVDHLVVAVGRAASIPVLSGFDEDNPPRDFRIAGDLARGRLGQVAIAVGDGIEAAMWLDEELGA